MTDDVELGYVVDLTLGEASGTELVADAAIGATTLTVDYAGDFEDVGEVVLNGSTLAYTEIAYGDAETDPDIITLAAPLAAAAVTDDKVVRVSGGEPLSDWLLHVSLGDGHPVDIPIPFEQRALWSSVDVTTPVPVMVSADLERLVEVPGRTPTIDGVFIDPTSTIPGGQAFSLDAPTATDGYPEDYGWWQVDAAGNVLGFWRLVGGVWTAQTIVTAEALKANNAIITALTGETITGTTIQTRATQDRGIKLGEVKGSTNYDEAFIVFNESGVPFIKAVPSEELAVIAGEVKATTTTVIEGASLGGVTEITRGPVTADNPTGTAGALRLTGYTTAPKSAPTVTGGYDTVQFTPDGLWADRHGWATDGTYWYTARLTAGGYQVERWSSAGTLSASTFVDSGSLVAITGVAVDAAGDGLYVAWASGRIDQLVASTLTWQHLGAWAIGSDRAPALGFDAAAGELLVARSRPSNSDKVRINRYTMPGGVLTASATPAVDTAFGYGNDLSGITYGTHDLGANRYIFTTPGNNTYRVVDTTGAAVSAEDWQSGMGGKVGFTYTGGAFVSMDTTGLMRTYTGQDKAVAIGDAALTKWVSNDLSTAALHTDQSPRAKITIKKRTKLNVTTSAINTGGTNAPDRVRIFVGQGSADPGRTAMWKQTGLLSGPVLPNLATNPSFESGATGWAAVSGSTAPVASTDRSWVGAQSLKTQRGAGTAIQIASRTITTLLTSGAGQYSYAIRVWVPAGVATTGNTGVRIAGAGTTTQDKDTDLRDQWVTLSGTFTWDGSGAVILYALDSAITAGVTIYLDGFHLVAGSTVPTTYAEGSGAPSDTPIGITSGSLSSLAASGTNPVTPNGFIAAAGTVQRLEFADGTAFVDGVGNGTLIPGTLRDAIDARANAMSAARMQAGIVSSGTMVAATVKQVTVTFPTAFSSAPKVTLTEVIDPASTIDRRAWVVPGSETTTGVTVAFLRASGTGSFDTNWLAVKP